MNLRDLQYLVAIADHLHFGRAAQAMHVSQPTLSMQVKKLEESLGVQLIERTNKSVILTPIGHVIVGRARKVLDEAEELKLIAASSRDPLAGTLRVGLFPTLAPYLLPKLMPKLQAKFPRMQIQLVEEKTPVLISQLESGLLDCALLAMPVMSETLRVEALFIELFLLAVSKGHRLAGRRSVKPDDLKKENVLLLEDGHCLRDQALEVCQTVGIGENSSFRATSLETLRHMVATSDAVTLMPALAAEGDRSARYIPFASPAPSRAIGLYWRATSARGPLYEALASLISAAYK